MYMNGCTESDHARFAVAIEKLPCRWIVSYDNVKLARELYSGYRKRLARSRYTAANRAIGDEAVFFSEGIAMPPAPSYQKRELVLGPTRREKAFEQRCVGVGGNKEYG